LILRECENFRNNNQKYSFAKHLNDAAHSFGPMNESMQVLTATEKDQKIP